VVAVGGMGIVLKARDPGLDRIVALKILPSALAANSLARARFIREARAAAAVVHEHVVSIYAVDEAAGLPYLVMQFVQGRTLAERIKASSPLPVEEILRIGAQTAAGLAAAHAQGLIHRDVKPGNILLENGVERVKITDFGLARATDDSSLTREGYIAGTPEYMSPEQARNEPVDQRSDLFSLGCVLYEMATGVSPFRAEKSLVAMRRVCDETPPAAQTLNSKLPEWLGQLIQRLMAKDAAARPQTAVEVTAEMERRLAEAQQGGKPHGGNSRLAASSVREPRQRTQRAWAVVAVLSLAFASFLLFKPSPGPRVEEKPPEPPATPRSAPFVIPASGDTPEQGFSTFAHAVAAVSNGGVIELQFSGRQTVNAVRRNEKALILRAGRGFEPVLVPADRGELLLFTHAPLVMEGLSVAVAPILLPGARTGQQRSVAIAIEDGPLLLAHCRLEMEPDDFLPDPRGPNIFSLRNVSSARLHNCELFSRQGFVLEWLVQPGDVPEDFATELWVQGCTLDGNGINRGLRNSAAYRLDLRQNTLAGDVLLHLSVGSDVAIPTITASHNLFHFNTLVRPYRSAMDSPLESLVRWTGRTNAYWLDEAYALTTPAVASHQEWLASGATDEIAAVSTRLDLRPRLRTLATASSEAEATAFTLTPEEQQQLAAQGLDSSTRIGADPTRIGPGQPYHDWRNSPAYEEWLKLVREHIPTVQATR
jgi:serine/threonine protein kinase